MSARLTPHGIVRHNEFVLKFWHEPYEMTLFPDGRAIIKGTTDTAVARYVLDRGETRRFLEHAMTFLDFALPLYEREGKRYLTIGIGCTGGRHRSVAIVGELERRLAGRGYPVAAQHRDVERP